MVPSSAGECLAWNDPELAPCLLGYVVLRDVEAYSPNEVEKGSRGGREGVMRGLPWREFVDGGRGYEF